MNQVDAVARAVLYEGYLLYPYTRSSAKNQVRWTFGGVYPPAWDADPSTMRTECLLRPGPGCRVDVRVRCLHLVTRQSWQEAAERTAAELDVAIDELPRTVAIALPAGRDGEREWLAIDGRVTVAATPVEAGVVRLTVAIEKLGSLFWLALLGAGLLVAANAKDIERYLKLRSM